MKAMQVVNQIQNKKRIYTSLIGAIFFLELSFPHASLASSMTLQESRRGSSFVIVVEHPRLVELPREKRIPAPFKKMPPQSVQLAVKNMRKEVRHVARVRRPIPFSASHVVVTAYSSTPNQTDSSPCITANGFNVCKNNKENVIAANFLPFGARVRFPEMFGDREFVVYDRMNKRFSNRVDIWMKTRRAAKQFGVKRLKMEVVSKQLAVK
ncbi:3D domain-containing protein [Candidatus Uhrbacteria bacterium]|nr:3D domain-containing protein [Candidatus Uhrbacteria bacterium]